MTIKELNDWALKHNAEDLSIKINAFVDEDGLNYCSGISPEIVTNPTDCGKCVYLFNDENLFND